MQYWSSTARYSPFASAGSLCCELIACVVALPSSEITHRVAAVEIQIEQRIRTPDKNDIRLCCGTVASAQSDDCGRR
jgi:hypothetical protein